MESKTKEDWQKDLEGLQAHSLECDKVFKQRMANINFHLHVGVGMVLVGALIAFIGAVTCRHWLIVFYPIFLILSIWPGMIAKGSKRWPWSTPIEWPELK